MGIYGHSLLNKKLITAGMTTGIKNVVFDFGGVLLKHKDWGSVLRESKIPAKYHQDILDSITDQIHLVNQHTMDASQFITHWVATQSTNTNDREYLDYLPSAFRLLMTSDTKFDYVDALLTSLKNKGYHLYYLSNWSKFGFEMLIKYNDMAFLNYFNGGFMSYELRVGKPYHGIYQKLQEQYKLNPSETLFLDDRLVNAQAAINCGWKALQFKPNTTVMELLQMKDRR